MLFSIIIVNYNTEDITLNCIRSITNKSSYSKDEYEIIVVDNNSREENLKKLKCKQNLLNYKLLINNENLGFGVANNIGVNIAKGEYLFFLNSDTLLKTNYFFKDMIKTITNNSDIGVLGCKVLNLDGTIQSLGNKDPNLINLFLEKVLFVNSNFFNKIKYINYKNKGVFKVGWVSGCCFLMKRKLFEEIDGFDKEIFMYSEDIDLCLKVKEKNKDIAVNDKKEIYHLRGASINKSKMKLKKSVNIKANIETIDYVLRKHNIFSSKLIINIIFKLNLIINNTKEYIKSYF